MTTITLEKISSEAAIPELLKALEHQNPNVRAGASVVLIQLSISCANPTE